RRRPRRTRPDAREPPGRAAGGVERREGRLGRRRRRRRGRGAPHLGLRRGPGRVRARSDALVSAAPLTAFRRVVPEDAWRTAVPADVAEHLPAPARPLPGEGPGAERSAPEDLTVAARLLAGGWLRLHGQAARGSAGLTF